MRHIPHVLHFINSFADGGTERQAIQLANALAASARWRVTVAVHEVHGPLHELLDVEVRQRVVAFPLVRFAGWRTLVALRALRRLLTAQHVDIVHAHGFYPNLFALTAATAARTPVRIGSKRELRSLRSRARAVAEEAALSRAQRVVVNCDAVRRELLSANMAPERVVTIYNALSDRWLAERPRSVHLPDAERYLAPSPPFVVVMVANFHHEAKDHATMLRAARRVVSAHPSARFILVGEGPRKEVVRNLCRELVLEEHVQMPGHCPDIPALLAKADACTLSSRSEGFPNAVLEYMAAGCPVVATNAGGTGEAVVDGVTGFLVRPGDDAAMAARLLELVADATLRARLGEEGRRHVLQRFTIARQRDATEALYSGELERAARRR